MFLVFMEQFGTFMSYVEWLLLQIVSTHGRSFYSLAVTDYIYPNLGVL